MIEDGREEFAFEKRRALALVRFPRSGCWPHREMSDIIPRGAFLSFGALRALRARWPLRRGDWTLGPTLRAESGSYSQSFRFSTATFESR